MTARRLRLHARTVVTLAAVRLGLPLLGVERTLRLAVVLGRHAARGPQDRARVVRTVRRVAHHVVPGTACLAQSIAVLGLLSSREHDPELVLGCRLTDRGWVAHAWVDCGGARLEPVPGGAQLELGRYRRERRWRLTPMDACEDEKEAPRPAP
jgi:hypothetical protein